VAQPDQQPERVEQRPTTSRPSGQTTTSKSGALAKPAARKR
jgi:hypothetical protein